jgi:molybdate transport system ATP-binding protein
MLVLDDKRVRLAAISYERGFDVDDLLLRSSAELRSLGLRIGGLIQLSAGDRGQCAASIHVVDLRSGQAFDIWEPRGACARGCRLDERGLLDAEQPILGAIADRVDLLVINRFGRAESLGRGLIDCFAAAIEADVPVLTAVRAPYDEAWQRFHGGSARELPADLSIVVEWALAVHTKAAISPGGEHTGRAELAGL